MRRREGAGLVGRLTTLLLASLFASQIIGMVIVWHARTEIHPILQEVLAYRVASDYSRVSKAGAVAPLGLSPDIGLGGRRFAIIEDWGGWWEDQGSDVCCRYDNEAFGQMLERRLAEDGVMNLAPAYHTTLTRHPLLEGSAVDDSLWLHVGVALPGGRWMVSQQGPIAVDPWRDTDQFVGFALLTAVVPQLLLLIWLARHYSRSLRQLVRAADRVSHGEAMPALPIKGPREVREITAAFNLMQQRLGDFVSDRTRMLAGIGHDLRTPLTALRLRAEFVEDEPTRESMVNNINRMMQLVEQTMHFAREDAVRSMPFVEIDLMELAQMLIQEQREIGRDVGWAGGVSAKACLYRCQPVLLRRALVNVIDNATAYGNQARIQLEATSRDVRFRIEDTGSGIPVDLLETATQPFSRGTAQRSGGVGLGLAIVRSCVKAHGGTLTLENRTSGGLRVEIALPR